MRIVSLRKVIIKSKLPNKNWSDLSTTIRLHGSLRAESDERVGLDTAGPGGSEGMQGSWRC